MIVKQIWTGNAYRNFNYLIACGETGEALAIDPCNKFTNAKLYFNRATVAAKVICLKTTIFEIPCVCNHTHQ